VSLILERRLSVRETFERGAYERGQRLEVVAALEHRGDPRSERGRAPSEAVRA